MSSHCLHDAIVGASVDSVGHEAVPKLVRRNCPADNSLADFRQYLPNALPGERFATQADEHHSSILWLL